MAHGGKRAGAGRPKGSINKTSEELRLSFLELVNGNMEQLRADLLELTPYERLRIITGLLCRVLPTKVDSSASTFEQPVRFVVQTVRASAIPKVEE